MVDSSKARPTTWSPIGSPVIEKPHGTDRAGSPSTLKRRVHPSSFWRACGPLASEMVGARMPVGAIRVAVSPQPALVDAGRLRHPDRRPGTIAVLHFRHRDLLDPCAEPSEIPGRRPDGFGYFRIDALV